MTRRSDGPVLAARGEDRCRQEPGRLEAKGALVIVNPRAGGGRAGRQFDRVRRSIERRLGPVDAAVTERPGHAIALARDAARAGRSLVVAVGGDGTLHEVTNGVLDVGGATAVGYVGQGTGGDFRRTLGIAHRLDRYLDAIAHGGERRIDAGKATFRSHEGEMRSRWFVNILSVGVGGLVDRHVARTTKAFGGSAAYMWASLRALAACERARLRCTCDLAGSRRTFELRAYAVAVCNGRYFGGGMHVAPMASPVDGRFEVVAIDAPGKVALAAFSSRLYSGSHLAAPGVQHFACDRISIELVGDAAHDAVLLDVDGEALGRLPVDIEIAPGAIRMRA